MALIMFSVNHFKFFNLRQSTNRESSKWAKVNLVGLCPSTCSKRVGEMALLRALDVLVEDTGSVPSAHITIYNHL